MINNKDDNTNDTKITITTTTLCQSTTPYAKTKKRTVKKF